MSAYFSRRRDSGEDYVEHVLHVELGSVHQLFRSQGPGDKGVQVDHNMVHEVNSTKDKLWKGLKWFFFVKSTFLIQVETLTYFCTF